MLSRADNIPVAERLRYYERCAGGHMVIQEPEQVTPDDQPLEDRVEGNRRFIRLGRFRGSSRLAIDSDANTARLFVRGPIDEYWGFDSERAVDMVEQINPGSLTIDMATPGGFVEEASTFWAGMRRLAEGGMPINAVASGLVASAGIPMFSVGEERSAAASATFMAHAPYIFAFALLNRARAQQLALDVAARLGREEERINLMLTERGISDETARLWMNGSDHWLTPGEARASGLLTVDPPKAPANDNEGDGGEPANDNDPQNNTAEGPESGQVQQRQYYGPFHWTNEE